MFTRVTVTAVAVALALAPMASADPGFTKDDDFMGLLTDAGMTNISRTDAIALGHSICTGLHDGESVDMMADSAIGAGVLPSHTDDVMAAAVETYCPSEKAAGIIVSPVRTPARTPER